MQKKLSKKTKLLKDLVNHKKQINVCHFCDKTFVVTRCKFDKKYCSSKCFYNSIRVHKYEKRHCKICNKLYTTEKDNLNSKYCSAACRYESQKGLRISIQCLECNKVFVKLKTSPIKFCSRRCFFDCRKHLLGEKNPSYKIRKMTRCHHCNKEIFYTPGAKNKHNSRGKKKWFCCRNCWTISRRKKQKIIQCVTCDKTMKISFAKYAKKHRYHCSKECLWRDSIWTENRNKNLKGERIARKIIQCKHCKKDVKTYVTDNITKYCSLACHYAEGLSIETRKKISVAASTNRAKQFPPKGDTSIERKIKGFTEQLQLTIIPSYYVDIEHAYRCDIYVVNYNLIIECDGDKFHFNPKYHKATDRLFRYGVRAGTRWGLDKIRTIEMLAAGYRVMRLWEEDINKMTLEDFKFHLAECLLKKQNSTAFHYKELVIDPLRISTRMSTISAKQKP